MPRNGGPIASRMAACQSDPLSQAWWPKILNPRFSKALPTIITQTTRNTYSASAQRLSKSVLVHSDNIIKFSSSRYFILGPCTGQHSPPGKAMPPVVLKNAQRLIECASARPRSEEQTSELKSLMRLSSAVFCVKHKIHNRN